MPDYDLDYFANGIINGDRRALSKAITLVESSHPAHRKKAGHLIDKMLPFSGDSIRIGITGVPGVGKSTFIEALGLHLVRKGHKVAVLTVDPSSYKSKGSILGDKTRMTQLVVEDNAFIRPSPSGTTLGGVAAKTRECIILCESAGFDIVIVETVGVGQSEIEVSSMVDFFLVLMLPGAGDELQGIKKGIIEIADAVIINKADGENQKKAEIAKNDYQNSLHYLTPESPSWTPVVGLCSALENKGIDKTWNIILLHNQTLKNNGELQEKRKHQVVDWMWKLVEFKIKEDFFKNHQIRNKLAEILSDIENGSIAPTRAVEKLFENNESN